MTGGLAEADPKQREVFNLTSIIGYYNEYEVAWKLAYGLEHNGVNIKTNVDEGLKAYAENYKKYILDNIDKFKEGRERVLAEMKRAEDGSEIIAKKMWDEIVSGYDLKLIDADVLLTGKEAQGIGKEDVKVIIRKRGTDEVQDMIKASLKLYKTAGGVNVYNATFASYLVTVLTGTDGDAPTGKKAIVQFLKAHPEYAEQIEKVTNITDEWTKIKTSLKKQGREDYRTAANDYITKNRGYQQMRDLLFREMWDTFYAKDKANINNRVLHRLGLDGADDVYLLVGTERQKMTAVSSRTSEAFKQLYANLKAGFNIRFDIPNEPDIVTCTMIIESAEGEPLAKFGISFKEGATFPHMWNMGEIVKDAKRQQK